MLQQLQYFPAANSERSRAPKGSLRPISLGLARLERSCSLACKRPALATRDVWDETSWDSICRHAEHWQTQARHKNQGRPGRTLMEIAASHS